MYFIVKIFTSALVIALVSELSKKSTFLAAFLVSLPLISILSFIWIYLDTKDLNRLSQMSYEVFWLVIPSLVFFLALPFAIKQGLTFWPSLGISIAVTALCYAVALYVIRSI